MAENIIVDVLVNNEAPVVDVEVTNRAGGIEEVLHDDTLVGDGVTEPMGVNPDIIPTKTSQLENDSGFLTRVPAQYVTETELAGKGYITDISGLVTKEEIETIIPATANAQNLLADQGFVNSSIQTSTAHFRGDWATWADVPTDPSLYPADATGNRAPTPNDYLVIIADEQHDGGTWRYKYTGLWSEQGKDGWQAEYQVNETPLTAAQLAALNSGVTADAVASFVKNTDYAVGGKAGVIKVSAAYGFGLAASNGYLTGINRSLEQYNSAQTTTVISKGALENIKNDYVKRGITENDITLTDEEKTAARTWIGAIGNTDYAGTDGSPGTIRTSSAYGTQMVSSGYLRAGSDTLESYNTRGVNFFVGKGTLENIKDDYVKRGITANTIALTDEEKAAAQAWLGIDTLIGDIETALAGV